MQFGSGSSLLGGGTDALNQAIAARQTGQAGAMQSVTPAAPSFDPSTQVSQAPLTGNGTQMPPQQVQPITGGTQPQSAPTPAAPFDPAEVKTILQAMAGRMKSISRLQGDIKG